MATTAAVNTSSTNWTPTHDEIAAQAYQIYLREGCVEGRDMDHWLRAESELRERTNGNGNGHSNGANSQPRSQREQQEQQTAAAVNRGGAKQDQGSALATSIAPPTTPIAQVNRGTTPKRNPNKRDAAAVK
jgi:hypothetical protein